MRRHRPAAGSSATHSSSWWRLAALAPLGLLVTACDTSTAGRFGYPKPVTEQGDRILSIWTGFMWVAVAVGLLVYGLILWACVRFRKRGDDVPRQVHYNLPVEALYTVLPFVMVAVLFYYTARDETYLDKLSRNPDVTIGVVGFQWSWQFNYTSEKLQVTGRPGQYPTLVLPAHQRVQFLENSQDVVHAFWVPDFLFKRDVVPGRTNKFEITTEGPGTFDGRCTELCGVYHSRMLFTVKVVEEAEYQQFLQTAKAAAEAGTSDMYTTTSTSSTTSGSAQ